MVDSTLQKGVFPFGQLPLCQFFLMVHHAVSQPVLYYKYSIVHMHFIRTSHFVVNSHLHGQCWPNGDWQSEKLTNWQSEKLTKWEVDKLTKWNWQSGSWPNENKTAEEQACPVRHSYPRSQGYTYQTSAIILKVHVAFAPILEMALPSIPELALVSWAYGRSGHIHVIGC